MIGESLEKPVAPQQPRDVASDASQTTVAPEPTAVK